MAKTVSNANRVVSQSREATEAAATLARRAEASSRAQAGAALPKRSVVRLLGRLAREPFAHFALLGVLTFALHRGLTARDDSSRTLYVSADKQRELAALFELRQHRAPNEQERSELVQRWFADEVLFREGLRLDLVHTDVALREQIVARMRGMLQASVPSEAPPEAELARYYAEHRSDYAAPERLDFRELLIHSGPDATDTARAWLRRLQQGDESVGAALPPATLYIQRSEAQLAALYGQELAHKLLALSVGNWHQLHSSRGVHLVRIDARTSASEPGLATVRAQVLADFRTASARHVIDSEIARLQAQWQLQIAGGL